MSSGRERNKTRQPVAERSVIPVEKSEKLPAWVEDFIKHTEEKGSLMGFCKLAGSPSPPTIYNWLDRSPDFALRFARARQIANDGLHEEQLEIADERNILDPDDVQHRKLRIWTRQQVLANRDPARFGSKQAVEHSGTIGFEQLVRDAAKKVEGTD
jgi:hypothetical protein